MPGRAGFCKDSLGLRRHRALGVAAFSAEDAGTVVHVYTDGEGYEVEFTLASGETVAVVTLEAEDLRPRTGREILHSRTLG